MLEVFHLAARSNRLQVWGGKGKLLKARDNYEEDVVMSCVVEVAEWVAQYPLKWSALDVLEKTEWVRKAVNRLIKREEREWQHRILPPDAATNRKISAVGMLVERRLPDEEGWDDDTPLQFGWRSGPDDPEAKAIAREWLDRLTKSDSILMAAALETEGNGEGKRVSQLDIAKAAGVSQQTVSRHLEAAWKLYKEDWAA
jgi:hypothetical protein